MAAIHWWLPPALRELWLGEDGGGGAECFLPPPLQDSPWLQWEWCSDGDGNTGDRYPCALLPSAALHQAPLHTVPSRENGGSCWAPPPSASGMGWEQPPSCGRAGGKLLFGGLLLLLWDTPFNKTISVVQLLACVGYVTPSVTGGDPQSQWGLSHPCPSSTAPGLGSAMSTVSSGFK